MAPALGWAEPGRARPSLAALLPARGGVSSSARVITPSRVGPAGTAIPGWAAGPGSRVPDWLGRSRLGRDEDRAGVLGFSSHPIRDVRPWPVSWASGWIPSYGDWGRGTRFEAGSRMWDWVWGLGFKAGPSVRIRFPNP